MAKTGNPNFAGLVSRKMKRMWEDVRLGIFSLRSLGQKLLNHRTNYHTFYKKWAKTPPVSLQAWAVFWAEFRALEGDIEKWYSVLAMQLDELSTFADEGLNIVSNHERMHPDDFIAFAKSLDRIELLLGEARRVFANGSAHPGDTSEEE